MPEFEKGFIITPEELRSWILHEDDDLLVINKPGLVVCHPSKHGPWSSLIGACREYLQLPVVHLVFRLDRETSGVVVVAKNRTAGSRLQIAVEKRGVHKDYIAILKGKLSNSVDVNEPLGPDRESPVVSKVTVVDLETSGAQTAATHFDPLWSSNGYTLTKVQTTTGRKHQIRAHAEWLGFPLVGDKIYGGNPSLFLDFIETGWTPNLAQKLELKRQALHAVHVRFDNLGPHSLEATAPLPHDLREFIFARMGDPPQRVKHAAKIPCKNA